MCVCVYGVCGVCVYICVYVFVALYLMCLSNVDVNCVTFTWHVSYLTEY